MPFADKEVGLRYHRKYNELHREKAKDYRFKNKVHIQEIKKKWYLNNKESYRRYSRKAQLKRKIIVISHYSNNLFVCKNCGFSDIRTLTIDHIDGGGVKHRKMLRSNAFYYWLIKNKFPLGFQVLCMNCQFIKRVENYELRRNNGDDIFNGVPVEKLKGFM